MLYTHEGCLHTVKKSPSDLPNQIKEMLKHKQKDLGLSENDDDDDDSDDSTVMSLSSSQSSGEPEFNIVDELDMFQELDEKTQVMFRVWTDLFKSLDEGWFEIRKETRQINKFYM